MKPLLHKQLKYQDISQLWIDAMEMKSSSSSSKRSQPRWQNDISEDMFQIYPKIWFEVSKLIQTGMDLHRSPNLAWSWCRHNVISISICSSWHYKCHFRITASKTLHPDPARSIKIQYGVHMGSSLFSKIPFLTYINGAILSLLK